MKGCCEEQQGHTPMTMYTYLYLSLSLSIYIYIYTHTHYICIYTYMHLLDSSWHSPLGRGLFVRRPVAGAEPQGGTFVCIRPLLCRTPAAGCQIAVLQTTQLHLEASSPLRLLETTRPRGVHIFDLRESHPFGTRR